MKTFKDVVRLREEAKKLEALQEFKQAAYMRAEADEAEVLLRANQEFSYRVVVV